MIHMIFKIILYGSAVGLCGPLRIACIEVSRSTKIKQRNRIEKDVIMAYDA